MATSYPQSFQSPSFRVKYFDAELSRRGKGGVRVATFTDRASADAFAAQNRLYARPCAVETVQHTGEPTVGSGSHTPALAGSTPAPGTISRDISEAIFASIEQSSTAFRIRRAIARGEVKVSPEFAALAATGDDAALIAAATSLPSASILSAQVETVSAVPAAPVVPAPAGSPTGGAQSVKVAELEIRREGTRVYALLDCHVCAATGCVERPGYHMDDTCHVCLGMCCVRRESTEPDWQADWTETMTRLREGEQAEAEALLTALEEEATDAAYCAVLDRVAARLPEMAGTVASLRSAS